MKKEYEKLQMEVIVIEENIITNSPGGDITTPEG